MDIDKVADPLEERNLDVETVKKFSKEAAKSFFDEYGPISHQINSYNEFITSGIQNLFDSLGEITVEPNYEPNKKGESGWRYATITYGNVSLEPPTFWIPSGDHEGEELKLLPRHARLQHMTYSSRMKAEVNVQIYTYETSKTDKYKTSSEHKIVNKKVLSDEKKEIVIGRIPVMVKSKFCWLHELDKSDCLFDFGGYFVIKGAEKTFIAQEKLCLTRLWVTSKPWTVSYWPLAKRERVFVKLGDSSKAENVNDGKVLNASFLYVSMPVWILFFALGVSSDKEIFQIINMENCDGDLVNILLATISSADVVCEGFRQGGKALQFLGEAIKKTKFPPSDNVEECISKYLFPTIQGNRQKALFLGYMVKSLLLASLGKRKVDNKDDFRNKRLALAGDLLARELQGHIRHAERLLVRAMQKDLCGDKDLSLINCYFDASIITNGLNRAFSTGIWFHPSKRTEKCTGVVATLRRTNPLQMLSDLRKTRQQVAYAGKVGDARYPNPSYWGKLCFLSTPDGENCGLVKNLAVTGVVSSNLVHSESSVTQFKASSSKAGSSKTGSGKSGLTADFSTRGAIIKKLVTCGMDSLESIPLDALSKMDKVLLNGDWVGSCRNANLFVTNLRSMRRKRMINPQVEIKRDGHQKEIRIFSDSGRIMRPLLIVENLTKIKLIKGDVSFQSLLKEEIIEFIGAEEEEDCITAWDPKDVFDEEKKSSNRYTHCELDLSFLLGLSCSIIPFANHNFARRVLFQSEKHSQQAIGYSTTNPYIRIDTLSHQMYYPQKPLFKTMVSDCLPSSEAFRGKHELPRPEIFNGQNAVVAVNVHQGYNQEDSLVMNRTSLERGMFRTEHFKSYKSEVDNKELVTAKHLKLKDMVCFGRMESRIGRIDSLDEDGFPFIGASLQTGDIIIGKVSESGADNCMKLKHTEKGMVQKVVLSSNDEGKNFAAVMLRQVRSPCVGDKFSSMHGQKGVIGFLEAQENFPFTIQGIVPDIVINPHAFPTRQTPGQLLEASLGKGICCGGATKYATPFTTASIDVITDQLRRAGFSRWGGERVCSGRTGEMMRSLIFMGPTFYQRLHHMAEDKMKFRNTGPVHPLTRQPVSDRKRFGGVKFGEMERDCLLAHGAAANLHERLFTLSDFSQMHVCQACKRAANVIQRPLPGGKKIRGPYCQICKSAENIVKVDVPYGAKLLYQELFSMGICLTFETEIC